MNKNQLTQKDISYFSKDKSVIVLRHTGNPYSIPGQTPQQIASQYVKEVTDKFYPDLKMDGGNMYTCEIKLVKTVGQFINVSFLQKAWGIAILNKSADVHFFSGKEASVISSSFSLEPGFSFPRPDNYLLEEIEKTDYENFFSKSISDSVSTFSIKNGRLFFCMIPSHEENLTTDGKEENTSPKSAASFELFDPEKTRYYQFKTAADKPYVLAKELLISVTYKDTGFKLDWKMYVAAMTNEVLWYFPLISELETVKARVFKNDIDSAGLAEPPYNYNYFTSDAALDKDLSEDEDIIVDSPVNGRWKINGPLVKIGELQAPNIPPPIFLSKDEFKNHSPSSDEFAAVNTYYHVTKAFDLLKRYGFSIDEYFAKTKQAGKFPITADHRSLNGGSGAHCRADLTGALLGFGFGKVVSGSKISSGCIWRVLLHEFSHAVLFEHQSDDVDNMGTLGFCHSFGNGLAAVLSDPTSLAKDKGFTFPGIMNSRHDGSRYFPVFFRHLGQGGTSTVLLNDDESEIVMAVTIFRLYLAIGGGHSLTAEKQYAADCTAFLLLFSPVFMSAPYKMDNYACNEYADLLQSTDMFPWKMHRYPGGVYHKVIRWAFEQSGAYSQDGDLKGKPDVDIYIASSRNGTYEYRDPFTESEGIIFSYTDPESPVSTVLVSKPFKIYVKVKNRGYAKAHNIKATAYRYVSSDNVQKSVFPDKESWVEAGSTTERYLTVNLTNIIIGPIEVTLSDPGRNHFIVFIDTDEDKSNFSWLLAGNLPDNDYSSYRLDKLLLCDNNAGYKQINAEDLGSKKIGRQLDPKYSKLPSDGSLRDRIIAGIKSAVNRIIAAVKKFILLLFPKGPGRPGGPNK